MASSPLAGLLDGPALVLERHLDGGADALVVLDGQDAGSHSQSVPYPGVPMRAGVSCRRGGRPRAAVGRAARRLDDPRRDPASRRRSTRGRIDPDVRRRRRSAAPDGHAVAPPRPGGAARRRHRCSTWAAAPGRLAGARAAGGGLIGVDQSPAMLARVRGRRAQERGVVRPRRSRVSGPIVAGEVPAADVVVCHHVAYNVARHRGLRRGAHRPGPARRRRRDRRGPPAACRWRRSGGTSGSSTGPRPDGRRLPRRAARARHRPDGGAGARAAATCGPPSDEVAIARRRLCLPAEREPEVAEGLRVLPRRPPTSGRSPGPATPEPLDLCRSDAAGRASDADVDASSEAVRRRRRAAGRSSCGVERRRWRPAPRPAGPGRRRSRSTTAPASAAIELAGGEVPRRQPPLEVGVDPPARHVAQIDGRRAEPADVADRPEDLCQHGALRTRRAGS